MVERWLTKALEDFEPGIGHYIGEPLLITENDHELRLHNGDAGVVISGGDGEPASAVFERDGQLVSLAPSRLTAVESLYAMTIHKSQGSQFDVVAVLLPEADSPILTRELLYTAVTRAQHQLILVGSEASVRAAVNRPVARATGLQQRLWGDSGSTH
jgi:exodeoxyribonuclease V alpha subunit